MQWEWETSECSGSGRLVSAVELKAPPLGVFNKGFWDEPPSLPVAPPCGTKISRELRVDAVV